MFQYWLAPHASAADCGSHVILLDVRADRYLALEANAAQALAGVVGGWPSTNANTVVEGSNAGASALLGALRDRGLIESCDAHDRVGEIPRPRLPPPTRALRFDEVLARANIGVVELTRIAGAMLSANVRRKATTLESMVTRVRAIRAAARVQTLTDRNAAEALSRVERVRPFFLASRNRCFTYTLALLDILAAEELYPYWVLGVQARPFAAHCWLQRGECVWGDHLDVVLAYTPILVV